MARLTDFHRQHLRRSQKRRVQRLRNQELKQAGIKRKQVWRPKDKPDGSGHSAPTCMVCFLPNEFMAPANQVVQEETSSDIDEAEQLGMMAQLVLAKQATFDKPAKNRHMRPLYLSCSQCDVVYYVQEAWHGP
jgi:hypothetical protein